MATRKAEVIYVGDASSIIRASAEAKAAVDRVSDSANKTNKSSIAAAVGWRGLAIAAGTVAAPAIGAVASALAGAGVVMGGITLGVGVLALGFKQLEASNKSFAKQAKASMAQFKAAMFQPLVQPLQDAMKQLPGLLKKVEPAFQSLFGSAASMIKPLMGAFVSLSNTALPQFANIIKASAGLIKPLADGFGSFIRLVGPELTQTIKDMQPILGKLLTGLGGMLSGLVTGVNVMLKALAPAMKPLSQIFVELGKIVGDLFTALAPSVKQSVVIFTDLLNIVQPLLMFLGKIVDTLASALVPVFGQLVKVVTNLIPVMMPLVKTIMTTLGDALTRIVPVLAKFVLSLVRDLAPMLPQLVKLLADLVKVGVDVLTKAIIALMPVFTKLVNALIKPFIPVLVKLTPLIALAAKLLGEGLVAAVKLLAPVLDLLVGGIAKVNKAMDGWVAHVLPSAKQVMSFLKGAWNTIRSDAVDAWDSLTKWLVGAWDNITNTISTFGNDISSGISSAFDTAANDVIGFVDDIIKAINLIPGVPNIHPIAKIGGGSSSGGHPPAGVGGYAVGGKIDRPMFMVGEEAPRHPEFVLATNPAYRNRNLGLWAQAGHELGIPGFAKGGILQSIGSGISSAVNAAGNLAGSVLSGGASAITSLLPGVGSLPSWIAGMGSSVLGDVTNWIKHKVSSLVSSIGSALGFGGGGGHPIPGGGGAMSQSAIESVWKAAGGPPGIAHLMAAIADAESSGIPGNIQQGQPYATTGWGLWQITPGNSEPQFGINQALLNPLNNARAAVAKYDSGGLSQWTTYTSGAYKQFYADGGTPGLREDESKIARAFRRLNALMGPRGDYNTVAEKLSYYPSLWQNTNSLLGSGASSFITTTDALGNPVAPFVNTAALNLTTNEENQELGWYGSEIKDIRRAVPIAQHIAPVIRDAIKRLKQQIADLKKAVRMRVESIKNQINENLRAMKALQDRITRARNRKEPYPGPKNKAQSAANAAFRQQIHDLIYGKDGTGGWTGEYKSLEAQNQRLGGTMTTVGTGGQIGAANRQLSAQVSAIQKRITGMQSNLSNVTGSGSFSPLSLQGITGVGGMLGPALLQQSAMRAGLASISPAAIQAALAAAQAGYTPPTAPGTTSTGTTTTAAPASPVSPTTSIIGPTTTQELANLLAGMPALAPGGGRAQGGPVLPGYVYRVGEKGPEDVAFGAPGHVMTAAQTAGGGGMHFHGPTYFTGALAAKAAVDRLAYRAAIGVA